MSAPPIYRALSRRIERKRIAEREAAGKCIACGVKDRAPGSLLCVDHLSDLDRHRGESHADTRDLTTPLPPPFVHPRLDAKPPSSRRRGAP